MVLTEKGRERIRVNRDRALKIQQKKRKQEKLEKETRIREQERQEKKSSKSSAKKIKTDGNYYEEEGSKLPIESFEENASLHVTKREAVNVYCLPEGTLAVLKFEEKQNPHNQKFKSMKLYNRNEVRYYAHKRHGGLDGLVDERNNRKQRKLAKDMKEARDVFK